MMNKMFQMMILEYLSPGNMGAVSIARRRLVFIHIKESSDADHVFVLRRGHALKIGVQRTLHRYRFQLR